MPRKKILIVLAACVLVGIGVVAFWPGDKEPEYNGKKLSEWMWVRQHAPSDARLWEAEDAVRHIGTNGLPSFIKWMKYEPPAWKKPLLQSKLLDELPDPILRLVFEREFEGLCTLDGFRILAPMTNEVTAELTHVVDTWPSNTWQRGLGALDFLGYLPGLVAIATNRTRAPEVRFEAMRSIGFVIQRARYRGAPIPEDEGALVTRVLVPCLEEPDVTYGAAEALGNALLAPEIVVPALTNAMHFEEVRMRVFVASALGKFRQQASCAIPVLTASLNHTDERVRAAVTNELQKIAPEVLTNRTKDF